MANTNIIKKIEEKKNSYFRHHFVNYIVDYKIEGEHIRIISNIGKYRLVKNTPNNIAKVNSAIVKNKVAIARKIDEYEATNRQRVIILLTNIGLVTGCGILVPLSFFIGSYLFFLFSIIAFSLSVLTTSLSGLNYYILVKEIQSLKNITGYKKATEFKMPNISVKFLKSRN